MSLIAFLVVVAAVALVGSRFRPDPWFERLRKPSFNPPDWVFPVAWTALYILLGLALAMILNARGARYRGLAIALFAGQMALNLIWPPLFFGAHKVLLGLIVIGLMFATALIATIVFGRIRTAAAWLMVPYLAWLCFAGALNFAILDRNPNAETLVPSSSDAQMTI